MTHLQHAQPVLFAPTSCSPTCRAFTPGREPPPRLGQPGVGQPAWRRRAGRLLAADRPAAVRRRARFRRGQRRTRWTTVADRDFAAEFCFAAALMGVHLSRLGEEIVLWSTQEFGWVEIDDAYATGSSIMSRRRRTRTSPSSPVARRAALSSGLTGLLTTLKGLPAHLQQGSAGGQGAVCSTPSTRCSWC